MSFVSATTLTDIFYITRKTTHSLDKARQAVADILTFMSICPVTAKTLELALNSGLSDFEDAIQIECAIFQRLDAILTRDKEGFLDSSVPVWSIGELLKRLD
ncbi:MAG: PIN domain-containing protein [Cyanobacteria bacterium P01_D01_bin.1]